MFITYQNLIRLVFMFVRLDPHRDPHAEKAGESMDGKVLKIMLHRSKNAPNVLNSGTSRIGNQLIRTKRCAHAKIAASITSEILLQMSGIFSILSTFSTCFILALSA